MAEIRTHSAIQVSKAIGRYWPGSDLRGSNWPSICDDTSPRSSSRCTMCGESRSQWDGTLWNLKIRAWGQLWDFLAESFSSPVTIFSGSCQPPNSSGCCGSRPTTAYPLLPGNAHAWSMWSSNSWPGNQAARLGEQQRQCNLRRNRYRQYAARPEPGRRDGRRSPPLLINREHTH